MRVRHKNVFIERTVSHQEIFQMIKTTLNTSDVIFCYLYSVYQWKTYFSDYQKTVKIKSWFLSAVIWVLVLHYIPSVRSFNVCFLVNMYDGVSVKTGRGVWDIPSEQIRWGVVASWSAPPASKRPVLASVASVVPRPHRNSISLPVATGDIWYVMEGR